MKKRLLWLALFSSMALACRPELELCGDNLDNDGDGLSDCEDTVDCSAALACVPERCDDGADNNGNGAIDCLDAQCIADPLCAAPDEICNNGQDDDNDNRVDCNDPDCDNAANCQGNVEVCTNNLDDDGDGDTDCDDADCAADPACQNNVEICNNNADDDGDGLTDCADADCAAAPNCQPAEVCNNNADDDNDGDIDCADPDCNGNAACPPGGEICNNNADDDGDTFIDCDDFDCAGAANCPIEDCDNGVSDDGDPFIDCDDFDCAADPACVVAESCDNNLDDDGDTFIDCDDFDCAADPACVVVGAPTEIQDVQLNPVNGTAVSLSQVFVTGIKGAAGQNVNLFIQEPQGDTIAGLSYPERAAMGAFIPAAQSAGLTLPAEGQCIDISGTVADFNGLTQLNNITALTIVANQAACGSFPAPFVIPSANPAATFADLATDLDPIAAQNQEGALTEVYEGVLVRVQNVVVAAGLDQFNEFPLSEQANPTGARINVDDFFLNVFTTLGLSAGTTLSSVQGIYSDVFNFKIQPRRAADIVP